MTHKGKAGEATGIELARKLGLDIERLKKDAASPEIAKQLDETRYIAQTLGVNATPLFIIGHNGIPGAPENLMTEIEKYVGEIRDNGCEVC
jgi:predicted DsbA family dithiol-disulfide isomerase